MVAVIEGDLRAGGNFDDAGVMRSVARVADCRVDDRQSAAPGRLDYSRIDDGVARRRTGASGAVIIDGERQPAVGIDNAGLLVDQQEIRVAAADIAGAADRAVIVQLGLRSADDRSVAVKLKRAVAFERNRSVERGRTAQVQRTELVSVDDAAVGNGNVQKGALTVRRLNDAAVACFQRAVEDVRLFEIDRRARPVGLDDAAVIADFVFKEDDRTAGLGEDESQVPDVVCDLQRATVGGRHRSGIAVAISGIDDQQPRIGGEQRRCLDGSVLAVDQSQRAVALADRAAAGDGVVDIDQRRVGGGYADNQVLVGRPHYARACRCSADRPYR